MKVEALREITEIERYMLQSPHVKELGKKPFPKDVYAAYAKVVLKSGETLTLDVDKRIVATMQKDNLSIEQIAEALSFSPNLQTMPEDEIIETFIRPLVDGHSIWAEHEIEKYLKSVFQFDKIDDLPYPKQEYIICAKKVLHPGETLTLEADRKVIKLMGDRTGSLSEVVDVLKYSPNYQGLSRSEVFGVIDKVIYGKQRKTTILIIMILGITVFVKPPLLIIGLMIFLGGLWWWKKIRTDN